MWGRSITVMTNVFVTEKEAKAIRNKDRPVPYFET